MKVYRIEHSITKEGPWNYSWQLGNFMAKRVCNPSIHPNPRIDNLDPYQYSDSRFGCQNQEILLHWFCHDNEWNEKLITLLNQESFVLSVYDVLEWKIGLSEKQVLFNLNTATLIATFPVESLYN